MYVRECVCLVAAAYGGELHDQVDLALALVLLAQLDDVRMAAEAEDLDLVLEHVLLVLELRLVDHLDRVLVPAVLGPMHQAHTHNLR